MATWGTRIFENDTAQDWVFDLMDNRDAGLVADTLQYILTRDGQLDATDCEEGLAAAEVVAALAGQPSEDFPEDALDNIDVLGLTATPSMKKLAAEAVQKVLEDAGLKEQWEAAKGNSRDVVLSNLLERLQ